MRILQNTAPYRPKYLIMKKLLKASAVIIHDGFTKILMTS